MTEQQQRAADIGKSVEHAINQHATVAREWERRAKEWEDQCKAHRATIDDQRATIERLEAELAAAREARQLDDAEM